MYIFKIFENIYRILITNHLKKKIKKKLFSKLHMYIFNFPKFNMCNLLTKQLKKKKKKIILFSKTYMYIFNS